MLLVTENKHFAPIIMTRDRGGSAQFVDVTNTGPKQRHVVMDRYFRGHELAAGETKNIEMLDHDIEYFDSLRKPGRVDGTGQLIPPHPVKIAGEEGRWRRAEERAPASPTSPKAAQENAPTDEPGGNTGGRQTPQKRS